MTRKPDSALKSLEDAAREAIRKAAANPLAPPRVRESMRRLDRESPKK
jgi:hypothetical protein